MISLTRRGQAAAKHANGLPRGVDWGLMPEYLDLGVWDRKEPRTLGSFVEKANSASAPATL